MKNTIFIFILIFFNIGYEKSKSDLKLISMNHFEHRFKGYDQNISFEYNKNGTIHKSIIKSEKFNLTTTYTYENNILISSYTKNSNIGLSNKSYFKYVNGKLSEEIIEGINPNIDKTKFIKIADVKYTHLENKIIITKTYTVKSYTNIKDTIFLDKKGNFLKIIHSNQENIKITFDGKNNPNDLVFPKYLSGKYYFGSGNKLKSGENNIYKHEYNKFNFPIESKEYKSGELIRTTQYVYNK